jgi:hypothetical protein
MNLKILCKNCAISFSSHISVPSSPTSHLHRTCQAPSASETKGLREVLLQAGSDLARLDSEIDRMQAALEALRQKREALLKFTAEHRRDPRTHPSSPTGTTDRYICTLLAALDNMGGAGGTLTLCTSMCWLEKGCCCDTTSLVVDQCLISWLLEHVTVRNQALAS